MGAILSPSPKPRDAITNATVKTKGKLPLWGTEGCGTMREGILTVTFAKGEMVVLDPPFKTSMKKG